MNSDCDVPTQSRTEAVNQHPAPAQRPSDATLRRIVARVADSPALPARLQQLFGMLAQR